MVLYDLKRVEAVFSEALGKPSPAERDAFLDQACASEELVRNRVQELLCAHDEAQSFLDRPAADMMSDILSETPAESPTDLTNKIKPKHAGGQDDLGFLAVANQPGHPDWLGPYQIQGVIGRGGFGIVLKGFDERLHRVVAIKVHSPVYAANGEARQRFIREARAAAAVKNEHVVGVHDVQGGAQRPYLVIEYIEGVSLQEKLDKDGTIGVKEVLRIGMQIAEGLAAAHQQGLVHRDIKPANILLENGALRVKITDFGLARAVDDASVTQSGTVAGTPLYMSPEQADGIKIDHRSDLFSLGTVLYEMCTGHPPFRALGTHAVMKRVIDASARPIREANSEIPDWLCDIIAKLHAKNPKDRFQTAGEVAELLRQHLADLQQPAQATRARRYWTPRRRLIAASLLVLGIVAIPLWTVLRPAQPSSGDEEFGAPDAVAPFDAAPPTPNSKLAQPSSSDKEFGPLPAAAPLDAAPPTPSYKDDKERLQGAWTVVDSEEDGRNQKEGLKGVQWIFTFAGDRCHLSGETQVGRTFCDEHGLFLADLDTNPKRFRVVAPGDEKQVKLIGIYEFQGEYLRMCYAGQPGVPLGPHYPTAFATKAGSPFVMMTFKRLPPKEPVWVRLLAGENLSRTKEAASWQIPLPGEIIADCAGQISTQRPLPANFHLRLQTKLTRGGIELAFHNVLDYTGREHSAWVFVLNETRDKKGKVEAWVWATPGRITPRLGYLADLNVWINLDIILRDNWTELHVNGRKVAELQHARLAYSLRGIRFELKSRCELSETHFDPKEVAAAFRNVEIKELPPDESGWVQLFNGKDLDGWKIQGVNKGQWKWEENALAVKGADSGIALLQSVKTHGDFELRFQARVLDTPLYLRLREDKLGSTIVTLGGDRAGPERWGRIAPSMDIMDKANLLNMEAAFKTVKESDFNDVFVRFVGTHLIVKINGVTAYDGFSVRQHKAGLIEWSTSGLGRAWVRNAQIKKLPPE